MPADGGTLRTLRISRGWSVRRMARELRDAADEPVATLDGLMHMINAWERNARPPSEMYWLLYVRVFPQLANATAPAPVTEVGQALQLAAQLPGPVEIDALEATALRSVPGGAQAEIRELATALRDIQRQVAAISQRLAELSGEGGEVAI
jgi:transcriptional regulator with XRE-family HTH domain